MRPNLVPPAILLGILSLALFAAPMPVGAVKTSPPADCTTAGDAVQTAAWYQVLTDLKTTGDHTVMGNDYYTMYNISVYFDRCAGDSGNSLAKYATARENQALAIMLTATLIEKLGSDAPNHINFGQNDYHVWPTTLRKISQGMLQTLLAGTLDPDRRVSVQDSLNIVNGELAGSKAGGNAGSNAGGK
jgi:hypothetical protein